MMMVSHDLKHVVFLFDRILLVTRRPATVTEYMHFDLARPSIADDAVNSEFVQTKAHALAVF
jgi:NitT/TauT family transport system ATP-binding protein